MLTLRNGLLFLTFMTLLILNLFQWTEEGKLSSAASKVLVFDKSRLVLNTPFSQLETERNISRNLFSEDLGSLSGKTGNSGKKTLEKIQLRKMTVRRDMRSYVLVGILVRNGKREGFITKGGESFQVSVGDKVNNKYLVQSISEESVHIFDPVYHISKEIRLSSGK